MTVAVAPPAPFAWHGEQLEVALPGGRVRFTTRRGGVSTGPYASLNLGDHVGDDPAAVAANRARAVAGLGLTWADVAWGRQVHGTHVAAAAGGRIGEADGQATAERGRAVAVFAADCVPIALVAQDAVAVVHAGWKGLADGVVGAGVDALRALGATGPVAAGIGPSARGCCYEVGAEVHARFADVAGARVGERRLALEAIARHRLEAAGVATVHDCGLCTLCAPAGLLFSHRRDNGTTGRQAAIAWRS